MLFRPKGLVLWWYPLLFISSTCLSKYLQRSSIAFELLLEEWLFELLLFTWVASFKCSICLIRDMLSLINFSRSLSRCLIFSSYVAITWELWSLCNISRLFKMLSSDSILISLSSISRARSLVSYSKVINAYRWCFLSPSNSSISWIYFSNLSLMCFNYSRASKRSLLN